MFPPDFSSLIKGAGISLLNGSAEMPQFTIVPTSRDRSNRKAGGELQNVRQFGVDLFPETG
jgi:hypothetical protein